MRKIVDLDVHKGHGLDNVLTLLTLSPLTLTDVIELLCIQIFIKQMLPLFKVVVLQKILFEFFPVHLLPLWLQILKW